MSRDLRRIWGAALLTGALLAARPPLAVSAGGESCQAPQLIAALPFNDADDTTGHANNKDTIAAFCSTYVQTSGPDLVYQLNLGVGNNLTITVDPDPNYDPSVYIYLGCGPGEDCTTGADEGAKGDTETFNVSGLTPGIYFLYVDSFYAEGADPAAAGAYALSVTGQLGSATTTTTSTTTPSSTSSSTSLPPPTTTSTTSSSTTSTSGSPASSTSTSTTILVSSTSTSSTGAPTTSSTSTTISSTSSTSTSSAPTTTTTSGGTTSSTPTTISSTSSTSTSSTPPTTTSVPTTSSTSTTGAPTTSSTSTTSTSSSTSTTTLPTAATVCIGGGTIDPLVVTIGKLRGGSGDETFALSGSLAVASTIPLAPIDTGLQVLLEDLGGDGTPVLDLTALGTPIPPGAPGTACDAKDGWTNLAYRNRSNAIDPPACTPGSARGLRTARLKDRRAKGKGIAFRITGRGATIAQPTGPLRLTIVLGADEATGLSGACASRAFEAGACKARRAGFRCR